MTAPTPTHAAGITRPPSCTTAGAAVVCRLLLLDAYGHRPAPAQLWQLAVNAVTHSGTQGPVTIRAVYEFLLAAVDGHTAVGTDPAVALRLGTVVCAELTGCAPHGIRPLSTLLTLAEHSRHTGIRHLRTPQTASRPRHSRGVPAGRYWIRRHPAPTPAITAFGCGRAGGGAPGIPAPRPPYTAGDASLGDIATARTALAGRS